MSKKIEIIFARLTYFLFFLFIIYLLRLKMYPIKNKGSLYNNSAPVDWYILPPPRKDLGNYGIHGKYEYTSVKDENVFKSIDPQSVDSWLDTHNLSAPSIKKCDEIKKSDKNVLENIYGEEMSNKMIKACKDKDMRDISMNNWRKENEEERADLMADYRNFNQSYQEGGNSQDYKKQSIEDWKKENENEWLEKMKKQGGHEIQ